MCTLERMYASAYMHAFKPAHRHAHPPNTHTMRQEYTYSIHTCVQTYTNACWNYGWWRQTYTHADIIMYTDRLTRVLLLANTSHIYLMFCVKLHSCMHTRFCEFGRRCILVQAHICTGFRIFRITHTKRNPTLRLSACGYSRTTIVQYCNYCI